MAFISKQCVFCTESTKRCCGEYCGKDEKGKYSGAMYVCDNTSCEIHYGRKKPQKQFSSDDAQRHTADPLSRSEKHRSAKAKSTARTKMRSK